MSLEVNLLKRLVEPRLRVWDSGVASWDKLGEAGGPLYVAVRRSRGWPWKVLRLAVPRGKRMRSGVVALLILWVEATGVLWSGIVLESRKRHLCSLCDTGELTSTIYLSQRSAIVNPDPKDILQDLEAKAQWERNRTRDKAQRI